MEGLKGHPGLAVKENKQKKWQPASKTERFVKHVGNFFS